MSKEDSIEQREPVELPSAGGMNPQSASGGAGEEHYSKILRTMAQKLSIGDSKVSFPNMSEFFNYLSSNIKQLRTDEKWYPLKNQWLNLVTKMLDVDDTENMTKLLAVFPHKSLDEFISDSIKRIKSIEMLILLAKNGYDRNSLLKVQDYFYLKKMLTPKDPEEALKYEEALKHSDVKEVNRAIDEGGISKKFHLERKGGQNDASKKSVIPNGPIILQKRWGDPEPPSADQVHSYLVEGQQEAWDHFNAEEVDSAILVAAKSKPLEDLVVNIETLNFLRQKGVHKMIIFHINGVVKSLLEKNDIDGVRSLIENFPYLAKAPSALGVIKSLDMLKLILSAKGLEFFDTCDLPVSELSKWLVESINKHDGNGVDLIIQACARINWSKLLPQDKKDIPFLLEHNVSIASVAKLYSEEFKTALNNDDLKSVSSFLDALLVGDKERSIAEFVNSTVGFGPIKSKEMAQLVLSKGFDVNSIFSVTVESYSHDVKYTKIISDQVVRRENNQFYYQRKFINYVENEEAAQYLINQGMTIDNFVINKKMLAAGESRDTSEYITDSKILQLALKYSSNDLTSETIHRIVVFFENGGMAECPKALAICQQYQYRFLVINRYMINIYKAEELLSEPSYAGYYERHKEMFDNLNEPIQSFEKYLKASAPKIMQLFLKSFFIDPLVRLIGEYAKDESPVIPKSLDFIEAVAIQQIIDNKTRPVTLQEIGKYYSVMRPATQKEKADYKNSDLTKLLQSVPSSILSQLIERASKLEVPFKATCDEDILSRQDYVDKGIRDYFEMQEPQDIEAAGAAAHSSLHVNLG